MTKSLANYSPFSELSEWIQQLNQQKTFSKAMSFFVKTSSYPLLYLENSNQGITVRYKSPCFTDIQHFYIDLYKADSTFHPEKLHKPQQIPALHSYLTQYFGNHYRQYLLVFDNRIQGLFIYLQETPESFFNQLLVFDNYIKGILWEEAFKKEHLYDEQTGFLNQKNFLKKLFIEVSRARRLNLPISLLLMKLDQIEHIQSVHGNETVNALLKALSKNILKDIRTYDITGSWPLGYMGLILPHTSERSAGIKAENLRWVLKSSDFSKVFPDQNQLSMSLGLAEYPKVGRSAGNLFESALKALSFASQEGQGDMTAVVTPAKTFKPDFLTPTNNRSTLRDFI